MQSELCFDSRYYCRHKVEEMIVNISRDYVTRCFDITKHAKNHCKVGGTKSGSPSWGVMQALNSIGVNKFAIN